MFKRDNLRYIGIRQVLNLPTGNEGERGKYKMGANISLYRVISVNYTHTCRVYVFIDTFKYKILDNTNISILHLFVAYD